MNWLKKIFAGISKKKDSSSSEVEREINIKDLSEWLDEKTPEISEQIKANYQKITHLFGEIIEKTSILSKVDISQKRESDRVKEIVLANRDAYVLNVNTLIKNTKIPENPCYEKGFNFYSSIAPSLEKLGKRSQRNIALTTQLIGKECVDVTERLQVLGKLVGELKEILSAESAKSVQQAKKSVGELILMLESKNKLQKDNEEFISEGERLEEKKTEIGEKVDNLKTSKENKEFQTLVDEKERVGHQIGEINSKIRNLFSPLQKPMHKFLQMSEDSSVKKLLREYVADSATMLSKDKELKILDLLKEVEEFIFEEKISLKDKKKKQALLVLKGLDKSALQEFVEKKSQLKGVQKDLLEKISENNIGEKLEDFEKELADIASSQQELKKGIGKLKGKEEKLTFESLESEIVGNVEKAIKSRIKLIYS